MNFRVQGLFQNDVQISVNPNKVSPYDAQGKKAQVEFRIKADPQSFVGLLAVDQSVKLLKEGNDITQKLV
jgi:CD109 antigen